MESKKVDLENLGFTPSLLVEGDYSHPAFPFEVKEDSGWICLRDVKGGYASICVAVEEEIKRTITIYEGNVDYLQFLKTRIG